MFTTEKKTGLTVVMGILCIFIYAGSVHAATGYGVSNLFTVDNRVLSNTPVITSLYSSYTSSTQYAYFLAGVSLNQGFTAQINWNGKTASQVKWYRNNTVIATDTVSGNSVSRSFNVSTDFYAGAKLYIQAIAADATASAKFPANFEVISPPPGLVASILYFQSGKYKSFPFNIGFPELKKDSPQNSEDNKLSDNAQVNWKSIIEVTAETDLNGHTEIKAGSDYSSLSKDDFKISEISVGGKLSVILTYDYIDGQWSPGGGFDLDVSGKYTSPPTYVIFMVGFIPVPTYYRFAVDVSVSGECLFTNGSADNPVFSGDILIGAGVEGMAGVGISNALATEGFLKGNLNFDFQLPEQPFLQDWYLSLNGGIRIYLLFYKYENNFLSYRWPEEQAAMALGLKALTIENLEPMSRDYLAGDYAQWHDRVNAMKTMDIQVLDTGGTETTLQSNIFGQSDAALAVSGSSKCLVWLYDEPSRNSLDRTMLVYSINDGGGWSEPNAIDDNGTADAMPELTVDSSGNFVCVWANASQLIPNGTDLTGFADKLDIQMAVYNSVTDTWTSETVTSTAALDYNPKVSCDSSGNITVVWTHDNNNDMLAENLPVSNTIIVRTKTGTGWETAQTLATTSGLVKYTDTEADSTHSYIVFCVDTDSDLASDGDNELFYMDNTSSSWSTPLQLTSDPNTDVNPQLVKTTSGLMLVWARDGNIVSTTDITGMTGITEVVSQQGSSSQRNFVATISPTGNISVIWNNPSAAGSDIYTATYDPTMLVWSAVVQMTDNRDMERSITAAYSTGDALELAYNKVHIEDGNGLDVFGQVDLCTYEYSVGSDLTVNADSIRIDDSNAVPGDTVIVQATVVNIGDTAVNNIPIAFYCGETADPCNQIDQTQLISGDLAAGNETIVSVSWTIPDSNDPLNIIIVADPNLQIEDKNRQNNSASIQMFGANLALANVLVNKTERGDLYITADVINNGFIPVPEGLEFDLKTQETITVDKQLVAALDPGEHHTITLVSSSHDLAYGEIELNVIVDADNMIEESSKTDNIRSVSVINLPSFNMDNIGIVDMVDFALFAEYWQRGDCEEPDWCGGADFELTGSVGFDELAKLAENWLKEL